MTAGDSLDGGAGSDKLQIGVETWTPNPGDLGKDVVVKNIEEVEVNAKVGTTLTMTNFTGVTSIASIGSTNAVIFDNVQAIPAVKLSATSKSVTVNMAPAAVAGLADAVSLGLSTVATSDNNIVLLNGFEKVNVSLTGTVGGTSSTGAKYRTTIQSSELENVTVTGSSSARLAATFSGASLANETGVFDASAATGAIDAYINAGATGKLSVTGGAGDDVLTVGPVTKEVTIAGGAGTDTLGGYGAYVEGAATQAGVNVTGFEVVAPGANNTVDQRAFANNTFVGGYNGGTYSKMAATFASLTTDDTVTAVVTRGATSTTDSLTVNLNGVLSDTLTLTADEEETLTFNSGGIVPGVTHTVALAAKAATKIVASGSNALSITSTTGATGLATVDASALTGASFLINAGASTANMTVTGAAGIPKAGQADVDTVNTITTGEGNDKVTGGEYIDNITTNAGNDTVVAGAGRDTVAAGEGNNSVDGGAGNDTITAGAGNDVVIGGAGDDNISVGAGNDSVDGGDGNDTIVTGAGNDTVLGGAGDDSIDVGAGTDSIEAGAGNDTITMDGLGVNDVVNAGEGTDSLTVTNASTAAIPGQLIGLEAITVKTSTSFNLDLTDATDKTSLKSYTIFSTDGATADNVDLTNVASGATVTISDDNSKDTGAATDDTGDIGNVAIDTVTAGTVTLTVAANKDAAADAATTLGSVSFNDASSVTIGSTGGTGTSGITHTATGVALDAKDTTSLTVSAAANAGLSLGNVTLSDALETLAISAGTNAAATLGTVATATSLNTLSVKSSGAASSATVGAITGSQLSSITVEAASGSTTTLNGAIGAAAGSGATSLSLQSLGAGSSLVHGDINLGTRTLSSLTYKVDGNSSIGGAAATTVTSGAVTSSSVTLSDNSAVANDVTFTGAQTALTMSVGRDVAFTGDLIFSGAVAKLALTTNTGSETVAWGASAQGSENDLTIGTGSDVKFGDTAAAVVEVKLTHNGTGALTYYGNTVGKSDVTGNIGADILIGGDGNDTFSGGAGADTITGGGGNDVVSLGSGSDTVIFSTAAANGVDSISTVTAGDTNGVNNGLGEGDVLNFAALLTAGTLLSATAKTTTEAQAQATSIAVSEQVVLVKVADITTVDTVDEIVLALADGGVADAIDVTASNKGVIIFAQDDGTSAIVVHVNNDATAAVVASEVKILATMTTSTDFIDNLGATNFAFV